MSGKSVLFIIGLGLVAVFSLFHGKSETYSLDGFGMYGRVDVSCPNGFRGEPRAEFEDPDEQEIFDEAQAFGLDSFTFDGKSLDEVCSGSQLRSWFWFVVFSGAAFAVYWAQRPDTNMTTQWHTVRDRISAAVLDIQPPPAPAQPHRPAQPHPTGGVATPPETPEAKTPEDSPNISGVSETHGAPEAPDSPQTEPTPTAPVDVSPESVSAPLPMVAIAQVEGGPTFRFEDWIAIGREPAAPGSAPSAALGAVPDATFTVSKTHALLGVDNGELWVEDLHSTNGTTIVTADSSLSLQPAMRYVLGDSGAVRLGDVLVTVSIEGSR